MERANEAMIALGRSVSVYWPGADEWYDAIVVAHEYAPPQEGSITDTLLHQLEYENGTIIQVCSHFKAIRSREEPYLIIACRH
jgi:hypothetical protein